MLSGAVLTPLNIPRSPHLCSLPGIASPDTPIDNCIRYRRHNQKPFPRPAIHPRKDEIESTIHHYCNVCLERSPRYPPHLKIYMVNDTNADSPDVVSCRRM
jgi:hypothetical protein